MEKVNCGTLSQYIERVISNTNKPLSEEVVASLMKDILSGLCLMHERNFVHRDLKPENILINADMEDGEVCYSAKLADFGLSTEYKVNIFSNSENMDEKLGTILYMAPE
jgi:calcium-dependent protein kinase